MGKAYSLEDIQRVLPPMIRIAGTLEDCDLLEKKTGKVIGKARAGGNLMVRPFSDTTAFIQLDDLTQAKLDRVRPVAFLTVQTSPGNQQAWVAVPPLRHRPGAQGLHRPGKRTGRIGCFGQRLRAPGRHVQLQAQVHRQLSEGRHYRCRPRQNDDAGSARSPRPCGSAEALPVPRRGSLHTFP